MRIYEELEKEANMRKEKLKTQLELIMRYTSQMKEDLGATDEAR